MEMTEKRMQSKIILIEQVNEMLRLERDKVELAREKATWAKEGRTRKNKGRAKTNAL